MEHILKALGKQIAIPGSILIGAGRVVMVVPARARNQPGEVHGIVAGNHQAVFPRVTAHLPHGLQQRLACAPAAEAFLHQQQRQVQRRVFRRFTRPEAGLRRRVGPSHQPAAGLSGKSPAVLTEKAQEKIRFLQGFVQHFPLGGAVRQQRQGRVRIRGRQGANGDLHAFSSISTADTWSRSPQSGARVRGCWQ